MANRYEKAELLAALWRLGVDGDERIPTSHGVLDRALKASLADLPEALKSDLTFRVTGVGLRCFELPSILLAAQEAEFTTEPNPTYLSSVVNLDEDRARQIVVGHGLSTKEAQRIGALLRHNAATARKSSEDISDVSAA
ncbi:hypothetical protein [Hoeflea poritis]|uniref:Transcriptional regulator n=1 Tax=Hoeflea poritis TaxID=2993659 RepID=A0ABT4VL58_9HYPH|nr:hypothetical protein [Hoeflea poritis]MDA4845450.1 hypothetical protein [Hoeflea poritis]